MVTIRGGDSSKLEKSVTTFITGLKPQRFKKQRATGSEDFRRSQELAAFNRRVEQANKLIEAGRIEDAGLKIQRAKITEENRQIQRENVRLISDARRVEADRVEQARRDEQKRVDERVGPPTREEFFKDVTGGASLIPGEGGGSGPGRVLNRDDTRFLSGITPDTPVSIINKIDEDNQRRVLQFDNLIKQNQSRINRLRNKIRLTFNERRRLQTLVDRQKILVKRRDTKIQQGTVTKAKKSDLFTTELGRLQTREARGKSRTREQAALVVLGFTSALVDALKGIPETPKAVANLIKNPKNILKIPAAIEMEGKRLGTLIRVSPSTALGRIGAEYFILKGSGKVLKVAGKLTSKATNKVLNLNPFLLKVKGGKIKLRGRNKLQLEVGTIAQTKETIAKQLTREGKGITAVSAQADRVKARTIRELLKRERLVRKPFPFEVDKLTATTQKLLKKFDDGKLSSKQILELNKRLRVETKKLGVQQKGIDLLERSSFFDAGKTVRTSRLGKEAGDVADASFLELLRGEATLFGGKARPQIIVIKDIIERIPRTKEFKTIIAKLKKSKTLGKDPNLTPNELAKLTRFQVTPSGKLKPIGSTTFQGGLERELTIAPGEIIKRVKKLGTLRVGNRRIPILAVKIVKNKRNVRVIKEIQSIKDNVKKLKVKKTRLRRNTKTRAKVSDDIRKAEKKLENVTKKKATKEVREFLKDSRRRRPSPKRKKKFRVGKRAVRVGAITKRVGRSARRTPSRRATPRGRASTRGRASPRPSPRPSPRKTGRTGRPSPRPSPRPGPRPAPRPGTRAGPRTVKPVARKKATARPRGRKRRTPSRKSEGRQSYNVFAKPIKTLRGKKAKNLIKVNKVPLRKRDAKDLRNFVLDTSLSATGKLKRTSGRPRKPKLSVPRGYAGKTKSKFRPVRIVRGKKRTLAKDKVIEKRRRRLDTTGEKRKISLRRRIKQLTPKRKTKNRAKRRSKK